MMLSSEMSEASDRLVAMASQCLIYGLVDPRTLMVRYVGLSSSGLTRPKQHGSPYYLRTEKSHKASWIRQLKDCGANYEIVVLQDSTNDELEADERWWISFGRACRWPLTNSTDGGGRIPDASRAKIGTALQGRSFSKSTRARMRTAKLGKAQPQSMIDKRVAKLRGQKRSKNICAKFSIIRQELFAHVTHCPKGHQYTADNLRNRPGKGRECKRCHYDQVAARQKNKRGSRKARAT